MFYGIFILAQPNSIIDGVSVYNARRRMGEKLWDDAPVEADVIIGVPESGSLVAMGMGRASGLPVERGLIKNRYIGRSLFSQHKNCETRLFA